MKLAEALAQCRDCQIRIEEMKKRLIRSVVRRYLEAGSVRLVSDR